MNHNYCIITIVNSITATSMPINEFVLYRSRHSDPHRQVVIVMNGIVPQNVIFPKEIQVIPVGNSFKKMRRAIKTVISQCRSRNELAVFHLNHQRSALLFFCATIFLNIRKQTIFTIHSSFSGRNLTYRLTSSVCAMLSAYVTCVSHAACQEYSQIVRRLKGTRFVCIPNGVDLERLDAASLYIKQTVSASPVTLVCIARMIPIKNHPFLIRVLSQLPHQKLILIGAEDQNGSIRQMVERLHLGDRVEFTGLVAREDVFRRLKPGDIFVSASTTEGLPVSALEAMYAGLIPVLSDIAPHREISEQCPGISVLPLDQTLWVETLGRLCQTDAQSRWECGQNIRQCVRAVYSLESMHKSYNALYEKLCHGLLIFHM